MKPLFRFFSLALVALSLTACLEEKCDVKLEYIAYEPVWVDADVFRAAPIVALPGKDVCHPAGFFVYGDYLLILDRGEGLHILDNSNPATPTPVSFLPISGAAGLAASNNMLYVNHYVDLLSFDISNPERPVLMGRTEDVFEPYSVLTNSIGHQMMVVEYRETDAVEYVDCAQNRPNRFFRNDMMFVSTAEMALINTAGAANNVANFNRGAAPAVAIGGSLARFTINNGTLYAVDESKLKTFDLSNPQQPEFVGNVQLSWNVETIFPNGTELYIGTNSGMHIMSVADPLNPVRLASLEHVQACDPVVVEGDRAYVTLRGGGFCGGANNQLEIVDVSNPSRPNRLQIYPMSSPSGLSVGNNKLFLCEPGFRFKVYELDNNGMLGNLLSSDAQLAMANDVIGLHWLNRLVTIGEDGINQVRYENNGALSHLSHIDICEGI